MIEHEEIAISIRYHRRLKQLIQPEGTNIMHTPLLLTHLEQTLLVAIVADKVQMRKLGQRMAHRVIIATL
jgi:hypothetical protein